MNEKLKSKDADLLIEGMTHLNTKEEYYGFLEDLLTANEFKSLAIRFKAAILLSEGKTYQEVAEATGASTATISRISKALSYGADGYHTVIARMRKGK